MLISRTLKIIETHTAGNPTRHILAGLPRIPGNTMAEKMQYMHDHMDWVRRMTMMEPRGGGCMSGTIYTQPCDPEADMGILYFDTTDHVRSQHDRCCDGAGRDGGGPDGRAGHNS